MKSTVTKRAQTVVPSAIRRQHGIKQGDVLIWVDDGEVIKVVRSPTDPIKTLRGCARGERLLEKLLRDRREEREREHR